MAVADVSDQLAWEQRTRPRVAVIAGLAGVLGIVSLFVYQSAVNDVPSALLLDSLQNLEAPGPIGEQETTKLAAFEDAKDRTASNVGWRLLAGLGLAGSGLALSFIGACTRARRGRPARLAVRAPAVGGVLVAIGILVLYIAQLQLVNDVIDGPGTVDAAREAPSLGNIGSASLILGLVIFAITGFMVALNAMQTGLLTRTMGILGMFVAVSPMLIGIPQPLLPLWTCFLVPLFLGRWMGGQPLAWRTGKEEPWPSAAQLREERMRAKGQLAEPDPEPVEERAAERAPHPSSKKRKRKRRG